MPLTFPSHAAAVLPLKLWRPAWFDGVALVIGSTAPDLPYLLVPYVSFNAHAPLAVLWFCVPVTVALTRLARRALPTVAAHLPAPGPRDYGVLGAVRHRWWVTWSSALIGAASHVLWDSFTHPRAAAWWPALGLDRVAFAGRPWWWVLQMLSTVLGGLVALALFVRIDRRRLVRAWHGPPPAVVTRPGRFRVVTATGWIVGFVVLPLLPGYRLSYVLGVRALAVFAVAPLVAGFAARPRPLD